MYAIEVTGEFVATHQLRLADGSVETPHSHNWRVRVRVQSARLDKLETVLDFHVLEAALADIIDPWQNKNLNDIPPFDQRVNPSAQRVAQRIVALLAPRIVPPARIALVQVTEAPGCRAIYFPENSW